MIHQSLGPTNYFHKSLNHEYLTGFSNTRLKDDNLFLSFIFLFAAIFSMLFFSIHKQFAFITQTGNYYHTSTNNSKKIIKGNITSPGMLNIHNMYLVLLKNTHTNYL